MLPPESKGWLIHKMACLRDLGPKHLEVFLKKAVHPLQLLGIRTRMRDRRRFIWLSTHRTRAPKPYRWAVIPPSSGSCELRYPLINRQRYLTIPMPSLTSILTAS